MDATFTLDHKEIKEAVLDWLTNHKGVVLNPSDDLLWKITNHSPTSGTRTINTEHLSIRVKRTQYTVKQELADYLK